MFRLYPPLRMDMQVDPLLALYKEDSLGPISMLVEPRPKARAVNLSMERFAVTEGLLVSDGAVPL